MKHVEQHIDFLDHLRGVAIIAVFLYPCLITSYGRYQLGLDGFFRDFSGVKSFLLLYPVILGRLGVAIFFVISGFCIYLSFSRDGLNDFRSFYVRRFFRLYPPYLCILLFFALIWPETSRLTLAGC
jgi:peptidoglycan/LPS O-acetylase OafA/YrhL